MGQWQTADNRSKVTPYAGVWIEISACIIVQTEKKVTPYAGVWIEICIWKK